MKKILITLFLLSSLSAFSQSVFNKQIQLKWTDEPIIQYQQIDAATTVPLFEAYHFEGAHYNTESPSLPIYNVIFDVPNYGDLNVQISNENWESFDKKASGDDSFLTSTISINANVSKVRLKYKGDVSLVPIRKTENGFERLVSFDLRVQFYAKPYPQVAQSREDYPLTSVLADADDYPVYKIPIIETGMYKLDKSYLESLGINIQDIDPKNIQIFGNGGGVLAEPIDNLRYNDLKENPIKVIGENDGSFDDGDAVIFYAENAHKWTYNSQINQYERKVNIYTNTNYYFLKIGNAIGLRTTGNVRPNLSGASYITNTFDDYQIFEEEKQNLLDRDVNEYGGGQRWFGASFKLQREQTFTDKFNFPNIVSDTARVRMSFMHRSNTANTVQLSIDQETFAGTGNSNPSSSYYAREILIDEKYIPSSGNPTIIINYPNVGSSEGWLDYITIHARRQLKLDKGFLLFRDIRSYGAGVTQFNIQEANNLEVWDITNPVAPAYQTVNDANNQISFGTGTSDVLRQFVAFNPNDNLIRPETGFKVAAQNLHGISNVDMLIVYHPDFKVQAERLAAHRNDKSDLDVASVNVFDVYNEFSTGKKDPAAIREMCKMLFERNPDKFKYLLLLGDGSFDPRGINLTPGATSFDFIPVYETPLSLSELNTYPSDDFMGLISEGEGTNLQGMLDIAIGRIPVRTATQAKAIVNKIIHYDDNEATFGDWRNRILHVSDNGDSNVHQRDNETISEKNRLANPNLNIDKIYLDAFRRIATTGDARVPDANEALNKAMFKGSLAVVYLGHGGPNGWTQERVLQKEDITSWTNKNSLPLFVTATCTFAGFDEESNVSAGEEVLLKDNGGAIALYTTVRPVFANQNKTLTDSASYQLFRNPETFRKPIGEILRIAKNSLPSTTGAINNKRKFQMLGDPSLSLAVPRLNIITSDIYVNEINNDSTLDTIHALDKVKIEGEVRNIDGTLAEDFNGIIYPTIYDKLKILKTLGQISGSGEMDYTLRKNILFKGRASVINGRFTFTFIVPKDIDYNYGVGKISYYAKDVQQKIDATGSSYDINIGGINENALTDDKGPDIEVFMNNWDWVTGGTTGQSPTLLARISDDLGINVVGNSIGHDLTGLLDNNSQKTYLLNDFYESELDDYTKGIVRFPLQNIEAGLHEIRVKAWDTANNASEGVTEFIVAENSKIALTNVLNYPNPFVNNTQFFFNHNQSGDLDVLISIYSISGRLVKTIEERIDGSTGQVSRENGIQWDGKDDFGEDLARGVYLYKVRLRNPNTGVISEKQESKFERLVIIK